MPNQDELMKEEMLKLFHGEMTESFEKMMKRQTISQMFRMQVIEPTPANIEKAHEWLENHEDSEE